tara:strand:+ start:348 stop:698 length:351 start_codon:yes stop_codon:yes gene_type:complete
MIQITPELVNINLEQVNYLIDLVSNDIEGERVAYDDGSYPYERDYDGSNSGKKLKPTKKQCQDHVSKSMQQHAVIKQLYILAAYSIETEAKMYPENFSKPESEVEPDLCDERGRPL